MCDIKFVPWYRLSCSWLSILLMLAYMGTVIVILLNILIAQMSTTYTQAKRVAHLQYDVDRILLLTRMERFPFLVCKRNGMDRRQRVCAPAIGRDCVFLCCPSEPFRARVRDSEYQLCTPACAKVIILNLTDFYSCNCCRLCRICV